jgi:hypothetical protein
MPDRNPEAPERVWIAPNAIGLNGVRWFPESPDPRATEYVRADLAAGERERMREALLDATAHLAGAISAYDKFRNKGITGDALYSTRIADFTKALERARAALAASPYRSKP